jgi:hypothetical protein
MLNAFAVLCAVAIGSGVYPSCRGGAAAVVDLPDPAADDRPPGSLPELPRMSVELPAGLSNAPTRVVSAGDNLQNALDDARPGDVIALQPGAVFSGPFTLPNKSGNGWITIRTNVADGAFPSPGTRVNPSDARLMPVIESAGDFAITAEAGAHHYRFVGIEVRPKSGIFIYNLIMLGASANSVDALPHHIVLERCYVHGDRKAGGRRGIALNSLHTAVIDSYIADFKEEGQDSQAICGWNGPGPFAIVNNYLEAAGENVMFGGADPTIRNLVPSDITIRENHLAKPLTWRKESPSYGGAHWTVKNLFELKNARRVLIEHNLFENNWPEAQNGYAILFTPRNQNGNSPWSMVRDVTFRNNIVRHVSSAVNMLGSDDLQPSQQTKRILISDNVFDDVSDVKWGGLGNLIQILNGIDDVIIEHNTAFETNAFLVASGKPDTPFTFKNNLVAVGRYGVGGDWHYGDPAGALSMYFPGAVFLGNVLLGATTSQYPAGNFFPASMTNVGFVNYVEGDYRLQATSPYKNAATDGKDIGANLNSAPPATQRPVRKRGDENE